MKHKLALLLVSVLTSPSAALPGAAAASAGLKRPHQKNTPAQDTFAPFPLPSPTPAIRTEQGWKLIYAAGAGQKARGTLARLLEAARKNPGQIAVEYPTFHGTVSAVCDKSEAGEDGELDCDVVSWCDAPNNVDLPARHGHRTHIRSDGTVTSVVITLNEVGDEKILAFGDMNALIAWYAR